MAINLHGRQKELNQLLAIASSDQPVFTFVRGRRRVGKSALLKKLAELSNNVFYFMGLADASDLEIRKNFAESFSAFSRSEALVGLQVRTLTWRKIFNEITTYLEKNPKTSIVLVLDEIQWISKKGSGFITLIKEYWLNWKNISSLKIIICGSSNKFFNLYVEGSEKILRGLKTTASIWVPEFSLSETEQYFLRGWNPGEVCLTYMLLGGIPYYLETIEPELGFVRALNKVLLTRNTIFLEEIGEILNLDFNKRGVVSAAKILRACGQSGATQAKIVRDSGLPESSVSEIVEKLVQYEILFERNDLAKRDNLNRHGIGYYTKDFYLNTYFGLLEPYTAIIQSNDSQLLLTAQLIRSDDGYYIPNFSGRAFERLVEAELAPLNQVSALKTSLNLVGQSYTIATYGGTKCQIDIVIECPSDRIVRLIECKWVTSSRDLAQHIEETTLKSYPWPNQYSVRRYLIVGYPVTDKERASAKSREVTLLGSSELGLNWGPQR